jgi:hypothetical protein
VAVALAAQIIPLAVLREPPGRWAVDIHAYRMVADIVLAHRDVYAVDVTAAFPLYLHPYLPMQLWALAAAGKLAGITSAPFFVIVRLPQMAAEVGTAALVYAGARRLLGDAQAALRYGLLFAVCPLPVLESIYHGQFDAISLFFALAAWYVFALVDRPPRSMALSAALLGLGILNKSWPAVLLPVFLYHLPSWRDRGTYLAIAAAIPAVATALYLLAYPGDAGDLYERVTGYSAPGFDGQTLVVTHLSGSLPGAEAFLRWEVDHGALVLFSALAAVALLVIPRTDALQGCLAMIVAFLVATTSGGSNHQIWIVPFGILAFGQRPFFLLWLAAATVCTLLIAFLNCGVYCGSNDLPFGVELSKRTWLLLSVEWLVLAGWLVSLIVASLRVSTLPVAPADTPLPVARQLC